MKGEAKSSQYTVEIYGGGDAVDHHIVHATSHQQAINQVIREIAERGASAGALDTFPVRPPPYPEDAVQVNITAWAHTDGRTTIFSEPIAATHHVSSGGYKHKNNAQTGGHNE